MTSGRDYVREGPVVPQFALEVQHFEPQEGSEDDIMPRDYSSRTKGRLRPQGSHADKLQ